MRIACVHQGYELYGSDRCFADSVAAIRAAFPDAEIEVVLPRAGPIVALIEGRADRITFEPIWVLRRRSLARLATLGLAAFPLAFVRAARRLRRCDLVYVNTSVVVDYLAAARFFPDKALLHIHEIPDGAVRLALRGLARWSGAEIVFNSRATRRAFAPVGETPGHVVYNGVAAPAFAPPPAFDGSRPLRLLMLGRVNRIKGQDVLIDALASLPASLRARIETRIVGGAFESPPTERALAENVRARGLEAAVSVEPFAPDPSALYRWSEVVVVPSRLPESLGRVAIEAMAYGRPPIVSAIGGLTEIVEDGKTGWRVPPGDAAALAARLRSVVEAPEAWRNFGVAARARYEALFSASAAANAITAVVRAKLARRAAARGAGGSRLATFGRP